MFDPVLVITLLIATEGGGGSSTGLDSSVVVAIIGVLIGGSGIAGWLTVRATKQNLVVEASNNAVEAVDKALDRIEKELEREIKEKEYLRDQLNAAIKLAASERERMQLRIDQLEERTRYLERIIARYSRRAADKGETPIDYEGPERRIKFSEETKDDNF